MQTNPALYTSYQNGKFYMGNDSITVFGNNGTNFLFTLSAGLPKQALLLSNNVANAFFEV
jgi:hypothetical protein